MEIGEDPSKLEIQLASLDLQRHFLWDGDQPYNRALDFASVDVKIDFTSTQ